MSVFWQAEADYLASQQFARIATVGADGQPHVVPVRFRYNPETATIDVGGRGFAQDKKYRDVQRNPRVAIVIDDVESVDPWRLRMIEIRGRAEVMETGGELKEARAIHRGWSVRSRTRFCSTPGAGNCANLFISSRQ